MAQHRFRRYAMGAAIVSIMAAPVVASATSYSLLTTIPVPPAAVNQQPGGAFTSFDISYFDPITGRDYVADRSNAAVDVFAGTAFVGRTSSVFTGQQATTSTSGPDGVLVVPNGSHPTLLGGNGNSSVIAFDLSTGLPPLTAFTTSTGGTFRADEMSFSPSTGLALVANNADTPAFGTLFNATTGATVVSHITIPGQTPTGGLEQPVWDGNNNAFYISVPTFNGTDAGGLAQILPTGTIGPTYSFTSFGVSSCSPTGLAIGASGDLLVGCGDANSQTVVFDPTTGSIVTTLPQISGSDEIWYDPTLHDFFVTGVNAAQQRVFDVFSDGTFTLLQSVILGVNVNAHSIAVDAANGFVYVPLEGTTTAAADPLCPLGCVAVFAQSTPEPATLALLGVGIAAIIGSRRRKPNP
jgi:WD40 repeat protein